ncbi:MAG: 30S ribosomal protein S20 [Chloroflexi bacterium]|nr:30S ribosomal protein S20 [Chloroflexota bacterium]
MAKGISAQKAFRRSLRQREVNIGRIRAVRTAVRAARDAISAGAEDEAQAVKQAIVTLDRAAGRGTIHPNNAARRKSRLQRRLNKATAAS